MITGAKAMVSCLENEGVSVIFGYPGATICPFYDELSKTDKIKHILVRQEQNAGHMASGYSRMTGKVGVCVVTSGPGATNLITGIATAYMDSIPIVAITGQVASSLLGRDVFQEIDITGACTPFVKNSYLVKKASDLPRIFKEAFHIAATGRPGPVLIDVPIDIQQKKIKFEYPKTVNIRGYKPSTEGNVKQVKKVADTIRSSVRPLICSGGGVYSANARDLIRRLSEEANIPVVTTMMGIGALPTDHPLNIGMIGSHGNVTANKALEDTDLLILVGARVGDRAVVAPDLIERNTKTIHIDVDPAEIGKNVTPTVPLVGDVRLVLEKLLDEKPTTSSQLWVDELTAKAKEEKNRTIDARKGTISPARFFKELGNHINKDAYVVADVGQNQIWTAKYLPIDEGRFMTTGGLGTMGYSLPAAIGIKIADPERQTLVVCGDGSFQMMSNELSTMVENGLDLKIILFNNRKLGMVNEIQVNQYSTPFGVSMPETPNFAKLAEAYGVTSRRINEEEDMAEAIEEMIYYNGPYLLELQISADESTKNNAEYLKEQIICSGD